MQQRKQQVIILWVFIAVAFVSIAQCYVPEHEEESTYRERRSTNVCDAAACQNHLTRLQNANRFNSSDYVRNLLSPANYIRTPGRNVSYFNLSTNPVIASIGIAFSLAMLEPCGVILPHIHPRGSKGIYMISGTSLLVGFIRENRSPLVLNTIRVGDATAIPRGAIHFVQNLGCTPAVEIAGYNNEDPGLLTLASNMFRFPDGPLEANFGDSDDFLDKIREKIPAYPLEVNKECRKRCKLYT